MSHSEIREKFIKFFKERGHTVVPSSSLLPADPSVLFTTAGMQQFKAYYTAQADPIIDFGSLNTVSIQKCIRTSDIDEVGDANHLTFFEMLGNFSFGGYFKKEAIQYGHDFITEVMDLEIDYISVFGGEDGIDADIESEKIWKEINSNLEIRRAGRKDNFWGPTGNEGPCGPTTEIYVAGLEVWNIVFNECYMYPDGKLERLAVPGVDTGMGLERLAMVSQEKRDIFETDLFEPLITLLPSNMIDGRSNRIITDHIRAASFIISDGVVPSNKEHGYILRRLLRRLIVHAQQGVIELAFIIDMIKQIEATYGRYYPNINSQKIIEEIGRENDKFQKTLINGLKEMAKMKEIDAASAFKLYESYGLPFEIIKDVAGAKSRNLTRDDFESARERHREISRAGAEKKFGGHGIVEGDLTAANKEEMWKKTRLHTATHVIVAALKKVLNQDLAQAGSDINTERLRFDFTFPRKITDEELKRAEDMANEIISKNLSITWKEVPLDEAIKSGASAYFKLKYPPVVKVYTIGDDSDWFSRELCGGPHVSWTGDIGHIRITKEESVSGGNRRIRAVID